MKYVVRKLKAVQFLGKESLEEIHNVFNANSWYVSKNFCGDTLRMKGTGQDAHLGDWIVEEGQNFHVMDGEELEETFSEADNG